MRLPFIKLTVLILLLFTGLILAKPASARAPDVYGKVYINNTNSAIVSNLHPWVKWTDGVGHYRYTRLNNDTYYFKAWQSYSFDEVIRFYNTWIKPDRPDVDEFFSTSDYSPQGYIRLTNDLDEAQCDDCIGEPIGFGCIENVPNSHRITVITPSGWQGSFGEIRFDISNDLASQDINSSDPFKINNIYYTPFSNLASCGGISAPDTLNTNQTFTATVTMNNTTGGSSWDSSRNYFLGSQDPQDNNVWNKTRVNLPSSIASGSSAAFSFSAIAPLTGGSYTFSWQMVQDGVGWFGGKCTKTIHVNPPVPNCSNLTGPDTLNVGQSGSYQASFSSAAGNLSGEVVIGDQNGNIIYAPGSRSYSGTNSTDTFSWTPTQAGIYDVFCRSWNDSIAECRGNSTYVDAPPRYTCSGLTASMVVTVKSPILGVNCSANPIAANTGQSVHFNAVPQGGSGTYSYSWSGDANGNTADSYQSYSTAGKKSATVTVTSGGARASCTASVTVNNPNTGSKPGGFAMNTPTTGCDGSSSYVDVSWSNSTSVDHYKVEKFKWDGSTWAYQIAIDNIRGSSYHDSSVSANYWYTYNVIAYNSYGSTVAQNSFNGITSNSNRVQARGCSTFSVSPNPVAGCNGTSSYIDVSWSYAGGTLYWYDVTRYKWGKDTNGNWDVLFDKYYKVDTTTKRDTEGLLFQTNYFYKVSAFSSVGYVTGYTNWVWTPGCYSPLRVSCNPAQYQYTYPSRPPYIPITTVPTYTQVFWNATVSGGDGNYYFDWPGGTFNGRLSGYGVNPVTTYYTAPGTFTENTKVTSNDGQTVQVACSPLTVTSQLPSTFTVNSPSGGCSSTYNPYNYLSWAPSSNTYYYALEKYLWNGSSWVLVNISYNYYYAYWANPPFFYSYDSGLTPNAKYAYRVKAINNEGITYGADYTNWPNAGQALSCAPPSVDIKVNGSNGPILVDYNSTPTISYSTANAASCVASNRISSVSPPPNQPLAYWRFDNNSSYIQDYSIYNASNAYWYGSGSHWTASGKYNGAAIFNGSSDYVDIGNPYPLDQLLYGDFTISGWIKPNTNNANQVILSRGDSRSALQNKFISVQLSAGKIYLGIRGDRGEGTTLNVTGNTPLVAGNWYYFTVVRSKDRYGQVFVNGVADSSQVSDRAGSITFTTYRTLSMGVAGVDTTSGAYLNGTLDDVKIYGSTLDLNQIGMDMNVPDPNFYWSRSSGLNGSQVSSPLTAYNNNPTIFTLTCNNYYSTSSDSVMVNLSTPTDLAVDSLSLSPSNVASGAPITFSAVVRNVGGSSTQVPFSVRFCIDNPSCISSSAGLVANKTVNALGFGASFTAISDPWTAPVSPNHTVYFCADPNPGVAGEPAFNRGNNCTSLAFTINSTPKIETSGGDVHTNKDINVR